MTLAPATLPVVRALVDEATRKNYRPGPLGVRARPEWSGPEVFDHDGVRVRVVPCVSTLAVREALRARGDGEWLVVLTDRDDADLGAGLRARLVGHRLRTPDPWDAVRQRFAAGGLDPALLGDGERSRDLATALLTATPAEGWPPAPGGVLTRDHAYGAVARAHLGLGDPHIDLTSLLVWSASGDAAERLGALRSLGGDVLTDALTAWVADRCGAAADVVRAVLRSGAVGDLVPLGLVAGLAAAGQRAAAVGSAREVLVRLEPRLGGRPLTARAVEGWGAEAVAVAQDLLAAPAGSRLVARADAVLGEAHGSTLAELSDLLPSGLSARLGRLAEQVRKAAPARPVAPDQPQLEPSVLDGVEAALDLVLAHRLSDRDPRVPPFVASVRLLRWLAVSTGAEATLVAQVRRQSTSGAWVDSALNDVAAGVADPDLGEALGAVAAPVVQRRDAHDRAFAEALARCTSADSHDVPLLEDLLPDVVLPLARRAPLLLLVLDGMSTGVCAEVVADVVEQSGGSWLEALLPDDARRRAALAVLPTLTEHSRTSLLCGTLASGQQETERRGYASLTAAAGLPSAALFHKLPLDTSRPGHALGSAVTEAVGDLSRQPLVTCVLNTIDDALDRSDPGGTDWTADAVKHLRPLLELAALAGRVVVLTSDHGHVVERRQGRMQPAEGSSSGRSRPAGAAGDGEVLVEGRRVLEHGGRAVLAVDERLRYGPLKAGYHGGASAAEAVVPVVFLVPGAVPDGAGLRLAPVQEPAWWIARLAAGAAPAPATPTLFDPEPVETSHPVAAAVLASRVYGEQKALAGRVAVSDEQVAALLTGLLLSPGHRLQPVVAASVLQVPEAALRGAVLHARKLLDVEGYPVLRFDADGSTVVLDEALLREQFELP